MSVLIRGMEMPSSCWDCYFQDCGNCRLNAYKVVDKCIIEDRRDEDCPLVSVSPHGRLIDADILAAKCDDPYWCVWLSDIDDAPTIIPAEEG